MSKEQNRYGKLQLKIWLAKTVLILSTLLFILCLVYFVLYVAVMFHNRSYVNHLNEKNTEMRYSQKLSGFSNSYFIVDFEHCGTNGCPVLRQVMINSSSAFIVNDILKGDENANNKNMATNYVSLEEFCLNPSSELMPLPSWNEKRCQFLNKKPSFLVKCASIFRIRAVNVVFDKFYNQIFNLHAHESYVNRFFVLRVTESYINVVRALKDDDNGTLITANKVISSGHNCVNLFIILISELASVS
ncbi:hypothetical protein VCUG_02005 [Vavraia culicis subsp. floridensis]|uniref:Uncharacterized protein n=1 Tax=Vavraia culicis (isolate floridensis) TaxID=948595 RepID=L2GT94_VAVCU|nr:uncharacterized protein VCUG_02005 [Vavraia culicis subsp. floridensis]ELA46513.1 hypothetical protein VCUG_02005 [Vavraia culicis subsp. floridensis]